VAEVLNEVPLDLLQFHGDEDAGYCAAFRRPWIKAARVKQGFDLLEYARCFAGAPGIAGLLLDAHVEGYGGGGQAFDWALIPPSLPLPMILSGGLNPGNVGEAIRRVRPWAVDVSSGVERAKGIKDMRKISEFIAGVRDAMQDLPYQLPDAGGHFGPYGGIFVAETLMPALTELREAYEVAQADPAFRAEFEYELKHYVGRPSPIYHARRWSACSAGRRSTSSAKTSTIPARTRSTTASARRCWRGAWASRA
jgi:hypothetical protein